MTMLVTGGNGQVALALEAAARQQGLAMVRLGRPAFDFDRPESFAVLDDIPATLLVNAAAYTAVDAAETDAEAAHRANAEGPGRLARFCAGRGIPLLHISTDYVFDGSKGAPYVETDPTPPLGVYGATKLASEAAAFAGWQRTVVLRTAWVYSATGRNFARTILNAARKTSKLRVVGGQIGCPTTAADLAAAIVAIAPRPAGDWQDGYAGVYPPQAAAGRAGTAWPWRCSRTPPGMGCRPRQWMPSPPLTGRLGYAGGPIPGWMSASWKPPLACDSGLLTLNRCFTSLLINDRGSNEGPANCILQVAKAFA